MKPVYTENVLPALADWRRAGMKTALVTLVGIEGSSPRPLGSQLAVNENGGAVGLITGGCAESAIIAEAVAAISAGENRCVRFGVGSPYMDVRLPCGSGIDVFVDVALADGDLAQIQRAQADRRVTAMSFDVAALSAAHVEAADVGMAANFTKRYVPAPRILIIGKGAILPYVAQIAATMSFEVHAFSSEAEVLKECESFCAATTILTTSYTFEAENFDRWTAAVTLFHEHEWELDYIEAALDSPCFYVGALGSRRTHAERLEMLREKGVPESDLRTIRGPVGLDIGAKSPPEIALSIVAEIVEAYRGLDL